MSSVQHLKKLIVDLGKQSEDLGIKLSEDVTDKMCQLCIENRLTAEEMIGTWFAFAVTKDLDTTKPTLELLARLGKDELSKEIDHKSRQRVTDVNDEVNSLYPLESILNRIMEGCCRIRIGGESNPSDYRYYLFLFPIQFNSDKLLEMYGTPDVKALKRQITPDVRGNKRRLGRQNPSPAIVSPSFSPDITNTPGSKYSSRKNAGEVVISFGKISELSWTNQKAKSYRATIQPFDEVSALTKNYRYMYEKVPAKAKVQNQWVEDMGVQLSKGYGIKLASPSEKSTSGTRVILGRVWTDGLGKLNVNQLRLEGPLEESDSTTLVELDVSNLKQFSFFPGQILAIEGVNSTNKFIAEKIYDGFHLPFSSCLSNNAESKENLHVIVAAGPYTTSDECTYNPLIDLLTYIEKHDPDVCILVGPFVDSKCDVLSKQFESQNFACISYEDVFQSVMDIITQKIETVRTRIVIVPSLRDMHNTNFVYPIAPFACTPKERFHFVSDPCVLDIDGVVIGITSVDILFHLGKEELPSAGLTDRFARLAKHILSQQSFYPLSPPNEDVNIDYHHFDLHGMFPVTPDILLLPSDFKYFIKNVEGCCVINPEHVVKGTIGRTFARIHVNSTRRSNPGESIAESISAEIINL